MNYLNISKADLYKIKAMALDNFLEKSCPPHLESDLFTALCWLKAIQRHLNSNNIELNIKFNTVDFIENMD